MKHGAMMEQNAQMNMSETRQDDGDLPAVFSDYSDCGHGQVHSSPDIDCCAGNHTDAKIGIWEKWATEKTVKFITTRPISFYADAIESDPTTFQSYSATAPPWDKLSYSSLVGIVKRLD